MTGPRHCSLRTAALSPPPAGWKTFCIVQSSGQARIFYWQLPKHQNGWPRTSLAIGQNALILDSERADDIVHQAIFISSCLLKHIAPHSVAGDTQVPTFSFISDRTIVRAMEPIESIEIEANADVLKPLIRSLAVAIYEAEIRFLAAFSRSRFMKQTTLSEV